MSKRQVAGLLGSPMLADPFNAERWDYVYYFYPNADETRGERRHLSLFFDGEILNRVEGDTEPPAPLASQ